MDASLAGVASTEEVGAGVAAGVAAGGAGVAAAPAPTRSTILAALAGDWDCAVSTGSLIARSCGF